MTSNNLSDPSGASIKAYQNETAPRHHYDYVDYYYEARFQPRAQKLLDALYGMTEAEKANASDVAAFMDSRWNQIQKEDTAWNPVIIDMQNRKFLFSQHSAWDKEWGFKMSESILGKNKKDDSEVLLFYAQEASGLPQRQFPVPDYLNFIKASSVSPHIFYRDVYSGYRGVIDSKMISELIKIEEKIPEDRQTLAYLLDYGNDVMKRPFESEDPGKLAVATIRVFVGTPELSHSSPDLPFMLMMKARGAKSKTAQQIEQQMKQNPSLKIFEVGKLTRHRKHPFAVRLRSTIDLFLLRQYMQQYPDGRFIVHATSKAHVALYAREYGLRLIETVWVPSADAQGTKTFNEEYILEADGTTIAEHILKRHSFEN